MEGCQHRLDELQREREDWVDYIEKREREEQEWFGDFIIEGNYTNDEHKSHQ